MRHGIQVRTPVPQYSTIQTNRPAVFGAYSYEVDVSINGGPGLFSGGSVVRNRWDAIWPLDGWEFRVRVRASVNDQFGGWTEYQTVTARPQLAPPPRNIRVAPLPDGFEVTWDPPTGAHTDSIVLYDIFWWNTTPERCLFISGAAFRSSPARVTGLIPEDVHLVARKCLCVCPSSGSVN